MVISSSDGLQKTFKVTQVNIQSLIDDLNLSKDKVAGNEQLVSQSREMVRRAEDDILMQ